MFMDLAGPLEEGEVIDLTLSHAFNNPITQMARKSTCYGPGGTVRLMVLRRTGSRLTC